MLGSMIGWRSCLASAGVLALSAIMATVPQADLCKNGICRQGSTGDLSEVSLMQTSLVSKRRQHPAPAPARPTVAPASHAGGNHTASNHSSHDATGVHDAHAAHDAHGHHHFSPVDSAMGACFLGAITFIMSLFYLVNHSDEDIRRAAYGMVSNTISIFCAVLLFSSVMVAVGLSETYWGFAVFAGLFLAGHALLPLFQDEHSIEAASQMGGHLIGFAAADCFGTLQRRIPFFRNHAYAGVLAVPIAMVVMTVMNSLVLRVKKMVRERTQAKKESHHHVHAIKEFEDDSFAFCIGFLLCQCSKYISCGEMSPLHGVLPGKIQSDVWKLFGFCAVFVVLLVVGTILVSMSRKRQWGGHHGDVTRRLGLFQLCASMAAAWSLLFFGQWQYMCWFPSSPEARSLMILALVGTFIAIGAIFVLDFLADNKAVDPKSLRAIISCVSIAVGLSWESAFHGAAHAVSGGFPLEAETVEWVNLGISVLMVATVLPAWRWYILPRAVADVGEESSESSVEADPEEEGKEAEHVAEGVDYAEKVKGVTSKSATFT